MAVRVRVKNEFAGDEIFTYERASSWYVEENGNLVLLDVSGKPVAELVRGYWFEVA